MQSPAHSIRTAALALGSAQPALPLNQNIRRKANRGLAGGLEQQVGQQATQSSGVGGVATR